LSADDGEFKLLAGGVMQANVVFLICPINANVSDFGGLERFRQWVRNLKLVSYIPSSRFMTRTDSNPLNFRRKDYGKVHEHQALRVRWLKQGQEASACDTVIDIRCHPVAKSSLASSEF